MPEPGTSWVSAIRMALPTAEPGCIWRLSIDLNSSSRLVVGGWATDAVAENVTTPTLTCGGCASMNRRSASWAASMRLGLTSVARMLPEVSTASITVSMRLGSIRTACGRAMPINSRHNPASTSNPPP